MRAKYARGDISMLIGVFTARDYKYGSQDDGKIEAQAPVIDIPKVQIDSTFHVGNGRCLTSMPIYLRPARQPWLHMVSKCIIVNNFVKLVVVSSRVRARPDNRHSTAQNVY